MVSADRRNTFPKFIMNSGKLSGHLSTLAVVSSCIKIDADRRNTFPDWITNSEDNFPLNSRNNKPTAILSVVSTGLRTIFPKLILKSGTALVAIGNTLQLQ